MGVLQIFYKRFIPIIVEPRITSAYLPRLSSNMNARLWLPGTEWVEGENITALSSPWGIFQHCYRMLRTQCTASLGNGAFTQVYLLID